MGRVVSSLSACVYEHEHHKYICPQARAGLLEVWLIPALGRPILGALFDDMEPFFRGWYCIWGILVRLILSGL